MATEYVETSGTGAVSAVPDLALLTLRFVHAAPDVASALDGCATRVQEALAALDRAAGEGHTRQTGRIDVAEHWNSQRQVIDGYEATQSLTVRLEETGLVGAAIAAVSAATGPSFRMDGLAWGLSDTTTPRAQARERAFQDARTKAEQLAGLGGRALGAMLRVIDLDAGPSGVPVMRATMTEAAVAMPAEAGDATVEVTVTGRWLLDDRAVPEPVGGSLEPRP